MGTTVTLDTLRELAGFRAEKGRVISLYVDLHPSVSPSAADIASRVNALLDAGTKRLGDSELPRDAVQGLKSDFERIRTFLDQELDRDGARGLAIFADELDNLWRPLTLPHSVGDAVRVNDQLYLSPLVPLVGRGEGALVVFVGRERGDIYCLRGGRLEPVADQTEEQPGQHDQGGWSQARYQRHIENLVKDHLKRVAEALDRRVRRRRADAIVVVASEDTRSDFEDVLSKEVREAVVGWTSCEAHAGPPQVLEAVTPVLEEWRARREQELLERWREESAKNGRAAAGWEATLEAASDGRVDVLLYRPGADRRAFRCPACGRLSVTDGPCPLDGTQLEPRDEGLDLALSQTLSNGGTILAVTAHPDLDPVEGVGALLRF